MQRVLLGRTARPIVQWMGGSACGRRMQQQWGRARAAYAACAAGARHATCATRATRAGVVGAGGVAGGGAALMAACVLEAPSSEGGVVVAFGVPCAYNDIREELEQRQQRYMDTVPPPQESSAVVQWMCAAVRLLLAACGAWTAWAAWQRLSGLPSEAGGQRRQATLQLSGGVASVAAAVVWQAREWLWRALGWSALEQLQREYDHQMRWMEVDQLPESVRALVDGMAASVVDSMEALDQQKCAVQLLAYCNVQLVDDSVRLELYTCLSHAQVDSRRHHRFLELTNSAHGDRLREAEQRMSRSDECVRWSDRLWHSAIETLQCATEWLERAHGTYVGFEEEWDCVRVVLFPSRRKGREEEETTAWVHSASSSLINPHNLSDRLVFTSVLRGNAQPMLLGTLPGAISPNTAEDPTSGMEVDDTVSQFLLRAKYGNKLTAR